MFSALLLLVSNIALADMPAIFNGKDLQGWVGNKDFWKVEDGVIVGTTPGINYNTFLFTDKEYSNFVLKFKVRLANHNSGVQFRSEVVDPKMYVMAGYQADIAPNYWGLLYEEKKRGMIDFKMDTKKVADVNQWIDMEVRADGPNITITTNGTKTVQYVEKNPKAGATTGKIGLQLHGGPAMKVEFKDITLEELPTK
ncbi:DUF1080 domain-containing protein [bacterium]|nr:DUF1080 domain-containing protein [bacterium]